MKSQEASRYFDCDFSSTLIYRQKSEIEKWHRFGEIIAKCKVLRKSTEEVISLTLWSVLRLETLVKFFHGNKMINNYPDDYVTMAEDKVSIVFP